MIHIKKNILLLFLYLSAGNLQGQSPIVNPVNTHCSAAERLCPGTIAQSFSFNRVPAACWMTNTKLYYFFKTKPGVSSGLGLGTMTASAPSTYKIYGPFENHLQGCEQMNTAIPDAVVSSASAASSHTFTAFSYVPEKYYLLEVTIPECEGNISITASSLAHCVENISCTDCIKGFQPGPGKYVVSAWVKEEDAAVTVTTYTSPSLEVSCPSVSGSTEIFTPSGQIIDGWQQIDGIYTIPAGATNFRIAFKSSSGYVLFDDVRIFPADGSLMSYVYDPVTLRLVAELDERNYAKLYEYDEEGKLIRIKKETEKGIMTIQENRQNSPK